LADAHAPAIVPAPAPSIGTPASAASVADDAILAVTQMGPQWETSDPFLFCAHHDDAYPAGNDRFGPDTSLGGRNIGRDFSRKDGWSMYHGDVVPGFPRHPHRGFETVTVVRSGLLDHSDSMGARARFGGGDVQWLTAGRGINHAEMFPLLSRDGPNPVELFQIWMNLPAADKMVEPYFTMFWRDTIPTHESSDDDGRTTLVTTIAGCLENCDVPRPPPNSWASRDEADAAIWTLRMDPEARWVLPAARPGSARSLYFFEGSGLRVAGRAIPDYHRVQLRGPGAVEIAAGPTGAQLLLLQGRPIGEPVARRGPFVMNTRAEIQQAYDDYRRTEYGGWPWPGADPVHDREERFAQHPDGRFDRPKA
jgi:redox-sensitive bicupin YhaK (pirin superfamily)